MERKIVSETAQARKSALYMALAPALILAVYFYIDPVNTQLLFTTLPGQVMLAAAVVLNALFLKGAVAIWRRDEPTAEADAYAVEKRFFRFSLSYLFLHFGALMADAGLRGLGVL